MCFIIVCIIFAPRQNTALVEMSAGASQTDKAEDRLLCHGCGNPVADLPVGSQFSSDEDAMCSYMCDGVPWPMMVRPTKVWDDIKSVFRRVWPDSNMRTTQCEPESTLRFKMDGELISGIIYIEVLHVGDKSNDFHVISREPPPYAKQIGAIKIDPNVLLADLSELHKFRTFLQESIISVGGDVGILADDRKAIDILFPDRGGGSGNR